MAISIDDSRDAEDYLFIAVVFTMEWIHFTRPVNVTVSGCALMTESIAWDFNTIVTSKECFSTFNYVNPNSLTMEQLKIE